jgi:hypothetical protein
MPLALALPWRAVHGEVLHFLLGAFSSSLLNAMFCSTNFSTALTTSAGFFNSALIASSLASFVDHALGLHAGDGLDAADAGSQMRLR